LNNFDDLPNPEIINKKDEITLVRWKSFLKDIEPLFKEIALKLRNLEPPDKIIVEQKEIIERHWFSGVNRREVKITKQGWEIGRTDFTSDYSTTAYLLPDGSIYPDTESGLKALFAPSGILMKLNPNSIEKDEDAFIARSRVIELLKQKYFDWCRRKK
jgi:hypothetical protein